MSLDLKENLWTKFKCFFQEIIKNNAYYSSLFKFLQKYENNILLYGQFGFPTDLFLDEAWKEKFKLKTLHKQECFWNKDMAYLYNQNFLEIDLQHPSISKHIPSLFKFLISIITNKNIFHEKHFIIIKHIDIFSKNEFNSFRIILEKYAYNAYFVCTTHKLDKIDIPVKSRFSLLRIPLFSHQEVLDTFDRIQRPLNSHLKSLKTRDVIKALFIAQIELCENDILTKEFCTLHFPPITELFASDKKPSIDDIRQFSYKCFQYNITITQLLQDILKIVPAKKKFNVINAASEKDRMLSITNKGRELIYLEAFLDNILL